MLGAFQLNEKQLYQIMEKFDILYIELYPEKSEICVLLKIGERV